MTTNQQKSIAEHVADYRKQYGWKLFPITQGNKHPTIRGVDISWKEDYIFKDKEFEEFPEGHGLGFASGEPSNDTAVIDFDSWEFFAKCAGDKLKELLAMTRVDRTPRGIHIFGHGKNIVERKIEVPNSDHKLEIFFGQFIDLPPTKGYETISTTKKIANFKDINSLITYVCDIVGADDSGKNKTGLTMEQVNDPSKVVEGTRNDSCFVYSRSLLNPLERNLSISEAWGELQLYNTKLAGGPLGDRELATVFKSAVRYNNDISIVLNTSKTYHETIGNQLMHMRVFKTNDENDTILVRESGVFVSRGFNVIRNLARELKSGLKEHHVREIAHYIRSQTFIDMKEFDSNPDLINLEDGVYNIRTNHFFTDAERAEARDDFLFLKKIETRFVPDAKCPKIEKFLEEILPDDERRKLVLERLALSLVPHKTHGKFITFLGSMDNGKSALMTLLKITLGTKRISSAVLQDLVNSPHALESLVGKNINITGDLPKKGIDDLGLLKDLVEGNEVPVNPKGFKAYSGVFKMIFFVLTNTAIELDSSKASWKRFEAFSFDVVIPKEKQIIRFGEILANEESEGFLQLLLESARGILKNGLTAVPSWEETQKNWVVRDDRFRQLFELAIVPSENSNEFITDNQIFGAYSKHMDAINEELKRTGKEHELKVEQNEFLKPLHFACPELKRVAKKTRINNEMVWKYFGWQIKDSAKNPMFL